MIYALLLRLSCVMYHVGLLCHLRTNIQTLCPSYPELFYLGLYVTLREVLYVGQLEVHLSQPHQDAVSCRLKLLSLADEVLKEQSETYKQT